MCKVHYAYIHRLYTKLYANFSMVMARGEGNKLKNGPERRQSKATNKNLCGKELTAK